MNITNFYRMRDYVPILNAVLITDLLFQLALYYGVFRSSSLNLWYKKFHILAVLSDVMVITLGIVIGRYIYTHYFNEYSLWKFLALVCVIQILHDLSFYYFVIQPFPYGKNYMMDLFKDYSKQHGGSILFADSLMIISSVLIATYLSSYNMNYNIIFFMLTLYIFPYVLYTKYD